MRVRGAAGLLLAPVFWITAQTIGQSHQFGSRFGDGFKALLWTTSNASQDRIVAAFRDGFLGLIVLIALLGLTGRAKFLVGLAALFQLVCFAPWLYYGGSTNHRFPPDWLRNVPWYPAPDITAAMWVLVMLVVLAMAMSTERPPKPVVTNPPPPPIWSPSAAAPGAPGYQAPYSPTGGGVPAGYGGPAVGAYPPTAVQPAPLAPVDPPGPPAAPTQPTQPTQVAPLPPPASGLPPRPPGFGPPPSGTPDT